MNSCTTACLMASLCTASVLFAKTNDTPEHVHAARHAGTNSLAMASLYPGMTNDVSATGTLIVEHLAEIENPVTKKTMLQVVGANETGRGRLMTCYVLLAADDSRVTSFGAETAATAPGRISDFLDQYVTIAGKGRVIPGKSGPLTQIVKITAIAKIPAPPGSQPVIKVSGTLCMETLIEVPGNPPHYLVTTNASNAASSDKQTILYVVKAADGSRVTSFGTATASTSPVAINEFLNQPVTLVGWGRELQEKGGKIIQIQEITGITK